MLYSHSLKGRRDQNEDQHFMYNNINGASTKNAKVCYLSVYDGHGGKLVSNYLKKNLPKFFISKNLEKIYNDRNKSIRYFKKVFNLVESNLEKEHPKAVFYCGSTSCNAIIFNQKNQKIGMWVINVGDSRAILCDKNGMSKSLSEDHKPNSVKEKKRITSLGGKIRYDGCDWRVKDLSVSRAFGDKESKPFISHLPDVSKFTLNSHDKFVILACDGLWDVLSNQHVCNFVLNLRKKGFKGNYAKQLAEYGYNQGSYDNISVVIYFMN
tara:strand:+ start:1431 stop:2231 length:801 start_codon:yes stop_codon:yes gene_type:complete